MKRAQGFTLVEVLLAMFLLALIMAIIAGVVVSTLEAQERVEELTLGTEIGPAILQQIRQDLEAAFVPDPEVKTKQPSGPGAEKKEVEPSLTLQVDWFVGSDVKSGGVDRDRIDFVSQVTSYGVEDALSEPRLHTTNEVGYMLGRGSSDHPDEGVLYRREDPWVDQDPTHGGTLTELYDRVLFFDVQYFDGFQWLITWRSVEHEGKLPEAVKVTIKLRVPDKLAKDGYTDHTHVLTVSYPK